MGAWDEGLGMAGCGRWDKVGVVGYEGGVIVTQV